jgi:hypothetical protein
MKALRVGFDSGVIVMADRTTRRAFCRRTAFATAGAAALGARDGSAGAEEAKAPTADGDEAPANVALPRGKIGSLELSRLMLGCNLITNFMHSRDLRYVSKLSKHYNTEAKILETFAMAEAQGITGFMTHHDRNVLRLLKAHREKHGGKLKWLIAPGAPLTYPDRYRDEAKMLADGGADGLYVHGNSSDLAVKGGHVDQIARAVEQLKATGRPAGVAGHALEVVVECEKAKVANDFYVKTLHPLNYPSAQLGSDAVWCTDPERLIEFMKGVEKPWIAYKVMAAGAIPPKEAFAYAYGHGADFILAGMFDFQLAEDARIAAEALAGVKRDRPWRG